MANGTLSSYFEKQKKGNAPTGGVSPYSVGVGDAGGTSPTSGGSAGGPSTPSAPSAPKGPAGGGTGFVSFGQYFGANAPAIQQQAQQFVQPGSIQAQKRAGGAAPKEDPYAAQIAQTSARFAALNPAAQSGDMGENVSAFDQLLGGGVTQRAAKQEQQRLGALRSALEGEQAQYQQAQARSAKAQEQAAQKRAEAQAQRQNLEDATLRSAKAKAYDDAQARGAAGAADPDQWWANLDPVLKEQYLSAATYKDESEYGSVSQ